MMQSHYKNIQRKFSIHAKIPQDSGKPGLLICWRNLKHGLKDQR
jgi:hypothetical protein